MDFKSTNNLLSPPPPKKTKLSTTNTNNSSVDTDHTSLIFIIKSIIQQDNCNSIKLIITHFHTQMDSNCYLHDSW